MYLWILVTALQFYTYVAVVWKTVICLADRLFSVTAFQSKSAIITRICEVAVSNLRSLILQWDFTRPVRAADDSCHILSSLSFTVVLQFKPSALYNLSR
jgi:hypothetical protein